MAARERAGVGRGPRLQSDAGDAGPCARARRYHARLREPGGGGLRRRPGLRVHAGPSCGQARQGGARSGAAARRGDRRGQHEGAADAGLYPDEQRRCIGGHPLCGSETAGVANARASLYEGATYFVTPGAHVDADAYQLLYAFLGDIGARPVAVDPEEHDRLMAVVSHLPHVLANVLMSQAGQHAGARDALLSAGPSFRDLTRIAGSNRRVWTDIFLDNRAALLAALAQFQEGLQEVLEALAADDARGSATPSPAPRSSASACSPPAACRPRSCIASSSRSPTVPACSRRSWSRSATPASTSKTSPCTT